MTSGEVVGKPQTRRQHYVPRFFLKNFSDEKGRLCCIRREPTDGYKLLENQNPENICVNRDLYEVRVDQTGTDMLFPNGIENNLAKVEIRQKKLLDDATKRIADMCASAPLTDSELDYHLTGLSIVLAGFAYRRPSELKRAADTVPELLKVFQEQGLASPEKLEALFRSTTAYQEELPKDTFTPESVAQLLAYMLNVLPYGQPIETVLETDMGQLARYLRNCSVLCVLSSSESPFVGLDFPTNTALSPGIRAHYWPIAKNMAVAFIDDGEHIIRKHEANSDEVMEWNKFALTHGTWEFAFCSDCAVMKKLYKELEVQYEQD